MNAGTRSLTPDQLASALRPIGGFMRDHEAFLLHQIASHLPDHATCAEIGSWLGRSSIAIALALCPGRGVLHTIDDHRGITGHEGEQASEPILKQFLQNLQTARVTDRVEHHPCSSDPLANSWTLPLDFLFIDGDHRYAAVVKDIRYIKHVKPGGWLAFHDSGNPDVARAIGEWWDQHQISPSAFARAGSILALRLPGPGAASLPAATAARVRKAFFWAACEIPPGAQPIKKLATKLKQSRARSFFRSKGNS